MKNKMKSDIDRAVGMRSPACALVAFAQSAQKKECGIFLPARRYGDSAHVRSCENTSGDEVMRFLSYSESGSQTSNSKRGTLGARFFFLLFYLLFAKKK